MSARVTAMMDALWTYHRHNIVWAVVVWVGLAWATDARAQDCGAVDADIFQTARRARAIVADYNRLHAIHRADLRRNEEFAARTNQEMHWRADLASVIAYRTTFGFDVCTNRGRWDASLSPFVLGALLNVDIYDWDVGLEAFVVRSTDSLQAGYTDAQALAAGSKDADPVNVAHVQSSQYMAGGRLTHHKWGALVFGYIGSIPLENYPGDDGRVIQINEPIGTPDDRVYLGLASPFGDTSLNLLFEPSDVATDIARVRADAIPIPGGWARGVAGVSYITDESEPILEVGLADVLDFLTVTMATELNPIRVRKAQLRMEVEGGPELVLHVGNTQDGANQDSATEDSANQDGANQDGANQDGANQESVTQESGSAVRLAADFGGFGQVSYFNSRHLEEQTSRSDVWGVGFGGFSRFDLTIIMVQTDLWFGINRPDRLARISDIVDHWQFGARFHLRFGF